MEDSSLVKTLNFKKRFLDILTSLQNQYEVDKKYWETFMELFGDQYILPVYNNENLFSALIKEASFLIGDNLDEVESQICHYIYDQEFGKETNMSFSDFYDYLLKKSWEN